MNPSVTVKENYEFRRIYHRGISAVQPAIVVYCQKNKHGLSRLGITVSAKLGKAHLRNHVRRQFREIYRAHKESMVQGYDLILVARGKAFTTPYHLLNLQYEKALRELRLLGENK